MVNSISSSTHYGVLFRFKYMYYIACSATMCQWCIRTEVVLTCNLVLRCWPIAFNTLATPEESLKVTYRISIHFSWCSSPYAQSWSRSHFLYHCLGFNIAISQTFSSVSPICGVVSILPRVDLTKNTEVDWFCIPSRFRLVILEVVSILGYASLKPEQEKVLSEFLGGKDVLCPLHWIWKESLLCYTTPGPGLWSHWEIRFHRAR